MAELSTATTVAVVYHSLFTVFACVVLVEFFRSRNKFCLKERSPLLALAQLAICIGGWVAEGIVLPFIFSPGAWCYVNFVWQTCIGSSLMFIHIYRASGLYWRFFLGKQLARSRKLMHDQMERNAARSLGFATSLIEHTRATVRQFRILRNLFFGYFGALQTFMSVTVNVIYFPDGGCEGFGSTYLRVAALNNLCSFFIASCILLKALGNFRDSFKIYLEIRRTLAVWIFTLIFLVIIVLYAIFSNPIGWFVFAQALPFTFQIFFVVAALPPLWDQRKLDMEVQACDFEPLESFDDILSSPAVLVALKRFMHREFCAETLEFFEAVTEYKNMYELWTSEKRLRVARVIYVQFVAEDAPSQINLSSGISKDCRSKLFGKGESRGSAGPQSITDAPPDAFDSAQAAMAKLIRSDVFVRFQICRSKGELESSVSRSTSVTQRSPRKSIAYSPRRASCSSPVTARSRRASRSVSVFAKREAQEV